LKRNLEREEAILLSLRKLDYLKRSQIQKLHDLKGDRNARRVLANMREWLSSFRGGDGELIFYLNKKGREKVGAKKERSKLSDATHYLMRNDAFIHFKSTEWANELKFEVPNQVTIIPDSYFMTNMRRYFLEVDHTQSMTKNREKIEKYKKLKSINVLQERLRYFPTLIWITTSKTRSKEILKCSEGLETKVILWDDIK
jgi:hypothetical protein